MSKESDIERLQTQIKQCNLCFDSSRKKCLLGHGHINCKIACVGEAPTLHLPAGQIKIVFGNKSKPFYEQFLTNLGESYDTVWTTNAIKCAVVDEVIGDSVKCKVWLAQELALLAPQYVIAFGNVAVRTLCGGGALDGGMVIKNNLRIFRVPHPMFLVYNPGQADKWIEVMKKVKDGLSKEVWF